MWKRGHTFKEFVKEWMLLIGMLTGAASYIAYHNIGAIHFMGPALSGVASVLQPLLLFSMLFLTFCKIDPGDMRIRVWQIWLLLIQGCAYAALSLLLILMPDTALRTGIEAMMLCLICPTATACAVVTGKLGGDMAGVLTYTILINLLASILIPVFVPLTNPVEGISFWSTFAKILAKVFPLLILPFISALVIRRAMPSLHAVLLRYTHVSFYIWAVSLALAIAMATRYIVMNGDSMSQLLTIGGASLLSCAFQFRAGKRIGRRYGCEITAGQALGQKNTVFAIWVGYTFMTPISSVVGGFYSIWHNSFNTWQLRRMKKLRAASADSTSE